MFFFVFSLTLLVRAASRNVALPRATATCSNWVCCFLVSLRLLLTFRFCCVLFFVAPHSPHKLNWVPRGHFKPPDPQCQERHSWTQKFWGMWARRSWGCGRNFWDLPIVRDVDLDSLFHDFFERCLSPLTFLNPGSHVANKSRPAVVLSDLKSQSERDRGLWNVCESSSVSRQRASDVTAITRRGYRKRFRDLPLSSFTMSDGSVCVLFVLTRSRWMFFTDDCFYRFALPWKQKTLFLHFSLFFPHTGRFMLRGMRARQPANDVESLAAPDPCRQGNARAR